MSLEGKRPPLSLHDEPELVREEQVVRRGGGFRQRNGMCEGPGAGGTGGVLVGLECRTWEGEWQERRTGGSA